MAGILRIGVYNLKYDKQKKEYGKLIFDFLDDEGNPVNGAITFPNGNGKGALLQAINQIFLPETSWGDKGQNQVKHFFMKGSQFNPYTFYVVIEWWVTPLKRLITGIAMSAERVTQPTPEVRIRYRLFGREFEIGDFNMEELPIWDEKKELAMGLEDFEEYLKKEKEKYFHSAPSGKSTFFKTCRDNGVYDSDWSELKKINRKEAGIAPYFDDQKNATTNETFVRNMLIPSITERYKLIEDIDIQKEVSEQFKDSASIAKNLPSLVRREKSHQDVLGVVGRFDSSIEEYETISKKLQHHKEMGENIVANIDNVMTQINEEITDTEKELNELQDQKDEVSWKESNLNYARKEKERKEIKEEYDEYQTLLDEAKADFEKVEEQLTQAELNLAIKKYRVEKKKYDETLEKIEQLEQSEEISEIKKKEQEVVVLIQKDWKAAYQSLEIAQNSYYSYMEQTETIRRKKSKEANELRTEIGRTGEQLNQLKKDLEKFDSFAKEMKGKYGPAVQSKPQSILKELVESTKELTKNMNDAQESEKNFNNETEKIKEEIGKVKSDKRYLEKSIKEKEKDLKAKKIKQEYLRNKISELLTIDIEFSEPTFEWISSKIEDLSDLLSKRKKDDKSLHLELLKIEQQLQLSDKDHFVPNADIEKVCNVLSDKNIFFQSGSEFLSQLSLEERKVYNRKFPSLKYSILVMSDLGNTELFRDVLLQSQVAVIEKKSFELDTKENRRGILINQADTFVEDPSIWEEYIQKSRQRKSGVEAQIASNEKVISSVSQLSNQLDNFNENESAEVTEDQLSLVKDMLKKMSKFLEKLNNDYEIKKKMSEKAKKNFLRFQEKLSENKQNEIQLNEFISALNKNKEERENEAEVDGLLKQMNAEEKKLSLQVTEIEAMKNNWFASYVDWKSEQSGKIKIIQEVIPDAALPKEKILEELIEKPILSSPLSTISTKMEYFHSLRKSMEEKQIEIITLRNDSVHYFNRTKEKAEELLVLNANGLDMEEPSEPVNILKKDFDMKKSKRDKTQSEYNEVKGEVDRLSGSLESTQKSVDEMVKSIKEVHGRKAEDWLGMDLNVIEESINAEKEETEQLEELKAKEKNSLEKLFGSIDREKATLLTKMGITGEVYFPLRENISNKIRNNAKTVISEWGIEYDAQLKQRKGVFRQLSSKREGAIIDIKNATWDEKLKEVILDSFHMLNIQELSSTKERLESIRRVSQFELDNLENDKTKGIEARKRWVKYASQFAANVVKSIFEMAGEMVVKNRGGHDFPLVKIRNKRKLPIKAEEYQIPLEDFFNAAITKIEKSGKAIESLTIREIQEYVSVADVVYSALGNQYPKFDIYYLDEQNVFMYDVPRSEYYIDWEELNEGSDSSATGSGGQKVSGRTIMFLMMMSHKRKVSDQDWQFIYMDNPLANAVSASVVDPIFAITEALRYQFIVVAPPELMKSEISMKFPSLHDLYFEEHPNGKRRVHSHRRKYVKPSSFMTTKFEEEVVK
ncbi:hypothetical protein [Evansella tamaricis]|uniref:Chromosome segregation ATPase n=1 Tax=Evansella tamaricis TaxID=2069301 RepID=A0ABS6JA23_9BACI|nr:hypothetical protein [Evansella tamaricis]MBU9710532.1 hypothetical protein [Evansella tamaricis]